jgi:hypothetical protein
MARRPDVLLFERFSQNRRFFGPALNFVSGAVAGQIGSDSAGQ